MGDSLGTLLLCCMAHYVGVCLASRYRDSQLKDTALASLLLLRLWGRACSVWLKAFVIPADSFDSVGGRDCLTSACGGGLTGPAEVPGWQQQALACKCWTCSSALCRCR